MKSVWDAHAIEHMEGDCLDKEFDLKKQLKNLPDAPGVYLMHDKDDTVIYVGKAKVLKNRVRQYFQSSKNHTGKVRAMVSHIAWFEYIITDSELEALVLECNLIKKYKPHYNILLKDDKHFPYLKVTMQEAYPRLIVTRRMENDGARYFGPYTGMTVVKNTLDVIKRIFLIPTCGRKFPDDIGKGRPCLNYQIKKCFAPCRGDIDPEEYRKVFSDICSFLEGKQDDLIEGLTENMNQAAQNLEFEKAASLRDKIASIQAVSQKQKIVSSSMADQDIVAFVCYDDKAFVEIFFVRYGRVIGRQNFRMDAIGELSDSEIMGEFLKQFYSSAVNFPTQLIISHEIEDSEVFAQFLSSRRGRKVEITVPKRGDKVSLIRMVERNARQAVEDYKLNRLKKQLNDGALEKLAGYLGLDAPLHRIESYDISNISGTSNVGAMVVFEDGVSAPNKYRKFRIKTVEGQDDYSSMAEVIYRRFSHAMREREQIEQGQLELEKAKFLPMPDLILLDGGKGHVSAVGKTMAELGVSVPLFGMVKDDHHRFRALTDGVREINLPKNSAAYSLVGNISEQVHKTAIEYHVKLRGKKGISSELANIDGIGTTRRKLLLKKFKSLEAIASAGVDELVDAGLDRRSAANVFDYFH